MTLTDASVCLQSVLAGLAFTDCYALLQPDRMHMGSKGIVERCVISAESFLTALEMYLLRGYLASLNPFPALRLPAAGLDSAGITATEMASLGRVLPVALLLAGDAEPVREAVTLLTGETLSLCSTVKGRHIICDKQDVQGSWSGSLCAMRPAIHTKAWQTYAWLAKRRSSPPLPTMHAMLYAASM